MLERSALGIGVAVLCATTLAWAQSPQTQRPQSQQPQTPQPQSQQREGQDQRAGQQTVTIVGCLQEERNVPGRQPNIIERAGIGEDFILTNASIQGQQTPAGSGQAGGTTSGTPGAAGTSGTTGGAQSQNMYQVTGLDDERLRQHIGQRVEVTGRLQARAGNRRPGGGATGTTGTQGGAQTGTQGSGQAGTQSGAQTGAQTRRQSGGQGGDQRNELQQIQATSIRQVSGNCPAGR